MASSKKKGGSSGGGGEQRLLKRKLNEKTMQLPVTLTDAEFIKFADELAQVDYDLKAHADYTDQVKKQLASRKADLVSRRSHLSVVVKSRSEPRTITVEGWAFFKEGLYKEIRTDSNVVIPGSTRPLQAEERQERLALDEDDGPAPHLDPEQKQKRKVEENQAKRGGKLKVAKDEPEPPAGSDEETDDKDKKK